jgi:hypothetical protein
MSEKKAAKEKKPRGRPCTYSHAIAEKICERLAGGESLRKICEDKRMPPAPTVRGWVVDDRHGFAERYARAFDMGMDEIADEILAISDEVEVIAQHEGKEVQMKMDTAAVARNRLRVDARKWLLAKRAANRYGDKQQVEHSGKISLESLVAGDDE